MRISNSRTGAVFMNGVNSILNEIRAEFKPDGIDIVKEYDSLESLLKAYVNDGITHGRYFNVLVFGETLYIDKGNDNMGNLFYYQQAIRLTDDVYLFCNKTTEYHHNTGKLLRHIIVKNIRAVYVTAFLPVLHKKVPDGIIHPSALKEAMPLDPSKRVKTAIKLAGKNRMHKRAIENYRYLVSTHQAMKTPGKVELSKGIIRDMTGALKKARRICKLFDERLDVLKQLPEKPEP